MEDQVIEKIIEALSLLCPTERIMGYHQTSIIELVNRFKKLGESEHYVYVLPYNEYTRVDILNNVVEQMKLDLIENKVPYLYKEDEDKSDFERGVLSAIRLIQHRVHCICD